MFPYWIDLCSLPAMELVSCVVSGLVMCLWPVLGPRG